MRILQLHNHHASKGGAVAVLDHEKEILGNRGHDVEQYTLPATEALGLSAARAGLKAVWNAEACRDVDEAISRFQPDVVHVHTPFPLMSPAVFRAAHRRGIATVATVHSFRYSCIAATCFRNGRICEDCVGRVLKLDGIRHRCYQDSLGASTALTLSLAVHRGLGTFDTHVDRYLTLTQFAKDLLRRDGIAESRIDVKANSVPDPGTPVAQTDDGEPYVAFAGRLVEVKGVHTLLEAWRQVGKGHKLRIAGDGQLAPLVRQHAAADESIEYLGWIDEDAVTRLMVGAKAVVVPSEWYEAGCPLVALRSLSVGTPVVVSDLENLSAEVLADQAGWGFAVGNPQALAETLRTVLGNLPDTRSARVRARRSYLHRFSPTANVEKLESVYQEVSQAHGRTRPASN